MALLLGFAFLSGIVTIFAPCIWPLLPIILSATVGGGERKPLGIVCGLMLSFTVFTLALSSLLRVIPFDPENLRTVAVGVIVIFGLTLVVPPFGKYLESLASRLGGLGGRFFQTSGSGFKSGFVTGLALGLVWSPCAGPILATVAALAATQALTLSVVLVAVAFVLGVGIPLFFFALFGQRILLRTRALSPYTVRIQQVFGVIMILAAGAIFTGYDQTLQVRFANFCSSIGITFLDRFQTNDAVTKALQDLRSPAERAGLPFQGKNDAAKNLSALQNFGPAPEFAGITNWLNVDQPLSLEGLRGKVVLVDFFTYSCINCLRTLPYVTSWYEKYKDLGFVVVGVHTPEFEFEKKTSNVADALERYNIHYPVAQDNDYATWQAYNNNYWPADYLIDASGNIREYHFGEGGYEETERAIQALLRDAGGNVASGTLDIQADTPGARETPETYLGSARMERFASKESVVEGERSYSLPENIPLHAFAYAGAWNVEKERAIASEDARLALHFEGKKVFLVMAPAVLGQVSVAQVFLDGKPIEANAAGADVSDGEVSIDAERLYELVDLKGLTGQHLLELRFTTRGTTVYAFTFS